MKDEPRSPVPLGIGFIVMASVQTGCAVSNALGRNASEAAFCAGTAMLFFLVSLVFIIHDEGNRL